MTEIVVSEKSEFEEMLRQAGVFAASIVSEQFHKQTSEIMTKTDLAKYLRCSVSKVNFMMKKDLPHFMFGETPRFRKCEIDEWLDTFRKN